ncbi:hypothetical protein [cf. Phormidesmis sp. LEGE 11477]|uniref:hypothetical protein n=1 Tax=cf. Phormidesmis sp. LEGE 11477 TaxID=1828680 RepID=UPI00187EB16B|nr:hypothetical protein [cf. Phormidesmis sp. LEGE 11477]MBE9063754.1 hypothetical protein [cf. Phormidesmis sp. LEGE 11477]
MALLEISVEQILDLIQQLPIESQQSIVEKLHQQLAEKLPILEIDEESKVWLEADLAGELPGYDWGPEGIPQGIPVKFDSERGVAYIEVDPLEE